MKFAFERPWLRRLSLSFAIALAPCAATADDWRQFRGSDSSGVSSEASLPTKLNAATLQWKSPLPGRGISGPIVVGDRVVLTASSGYRDDELHILCFSASTGEQLWERRFKATGRTICHEVMSMATPQPCSDGERIYATYSCNDVVCLDLDGNLIWYRGMGLD
jgi:outer membrane protein assembly factor BamB